MFLDSMKLHYFYTTNIIGLSQSVYGGQSQVSEVRNICILVASAIGRSRHKIIDGITKSTIQYHLPLLPYDTRGYLMGLTSTSYLLFIFKTDMHHPQASMHLVPYA